MSRKDRRRHKFVQPLDPAPDYELQATPMILRDVGWEFVKVIGEQVYEGFKDDDFRCLTFLPDGRTLVDGRVEDVLIKAFYVPMKDFAPRPIDRIIMITPYRDPKGIKILYFKWEDETLYDSFAVPDGQNRVWENREKK